MLRSQFPFKILGSCFHLNYRAFLWKKKSVAFSPREKIRAAHALRHRSNNSNFLQVLYLIRREEWVSRWRYQFRWGGSRLENVTCGSAPTATEGRNGNLCEYINEILKRQLLTVPPRKWISAGIDEGVQNVNCFKTPAQATLQW